MGCRLRGSKGEGEEEGGETPFRPAVGSCFRRNDEVRGRSDQECFESI